MSGIMEDLHNPNITPEGNFRLTYFPYAMDAEPHTPLEEAIQYLYDCWDYEEVYCPWTRKTKKRLLNVINNVLLPVCEEGNQDAIHWMFVAYLEGLGVEKDDGKALEYLKILAEYGYPDMQCELGKWYKTIDWRTHKRKMKRNAAEWFKKAAEQGNAEAMYCLAECYIDGDGVRASRKKTIEWFTKAAELGNEEARAELEFYKKAYRRRKRREIFQDFEEDRILGDSFFEPDNYELPF